MAGRREYLKPPILEATFAAHFMASEHWGFSTPSVLFDRLKETYAVEPKQISGSSFQIANDETEAEVAALRVVAQQPIYEFASKDSRRLIRVGRNDLTVHMLAPYEGWEGFRSDIKRALSAYIDVAAPAEVERIGIRYVNTIDLPPDPVELNDYFNISVDVPESLGFRVVNFFDRSESIIPENNIKLIQTFASKPGSTPAVLLDLDVIKEPADIPATAGEILTRLDELRDLERMAFEAAITDHLREVFDANR
ncbi:TIGR04255 family protein [Actinoplanes sp. TBRC 11911]|uniref:TIGR04255 family protein n=1 Tax=Actinoplanes sp. TBRC 11911 TaxID=2729386 RepID=UPI00145DCEC4|nr:TIGR04255 family protein [Actinoplanes sp. TBRC 11911]NMO50921.1 TIGR04255 family protein [Actinoplanes sp. TBRC 11911]